MITVDTNILARAFLNDEPKQSGLARRFLEKAAQNGQRIFIPQMVVMEFIWLLKTRKWERASVATTLDHLLHNHDYQVGNNGVLERALQLYKKGKAEFADYVIYAESLAKPSATLISFDTQLQKEFPDFILKPEALR